MDTNKIDALAALDSILETADDPGGLSVGEVEDLTTIRANLASLIYEAECAALSLPAAHATKLVAAIAKVQP